MATSTEIQADIDAVRAARLALAKGERVDEVWRDGRRLVTGKVTLDGLTTLISTLECDLADVLTDESGTRRRRPISLAWKN